MDYSAVIVEQSRRYLKVTVSSAVQCKGVKLNVEFV